MLDEFVGELVVVDLSSPYVCLGRLSAVSEHFLDLRDTHTSRENYVAAAVATGIKRNRERVLLSRSEVVAIARLAAVVDE